MTTLTLGVLLASLLGSLHCAGMCGGLVALYAGDPGHRGARAVTGHVAYNGGRLLAYAALGGVAGAAGGALDLGAALIGVQRVAGVVAGALIAGWGALMLGAALGWRVPRLEPPAALGSLLARGLRPLAGRPVAVRALAIGLLTGCLPCGWLYAFVVTAAGTGSAAAGAATMSAFWLGTLPVMASLGAGLRAVAGPLRRHVPAACAAAMIALGVLAVAGRVAQAPLVRPDQPHGAAHAHR